ncbi:uncharacterized protein LOC122022829 [Zingiber officinale]|uniref:uncharacterized protein LOC122022829 n=1 Tax=Zingiber officinale TaxID=94328 RepID=UPI001C4D5C8C|nr:uncharacterized protein LOC122022829 [Zingiber officinale]
MATSITQLQSQGSGQLPSQIVPNPKGNVSAITLRSGKSTGEAELIPLAPFTNLVSLEQETEQSGHLPFLQRSVEIGKKDDRKAEELRELVDTFSKVEVNIPLLKVIKHIPKYAKFLKDLCVHKRKLKGSELVSMGKNVSALIQTMPQKCKDPGIFTIPCVIGDSNFGDAMLDLGASVNVMPKSIFEALCIGPLQTTGIVIQLANRSLVHPVGVIEDVLVKVKDLIFPADFYILDMEGNVSPGQAPLILGRPFLKTARTKIDVHAGTLTMEFGDTIVQFNILDAMKYPSEDHSLLSIDVFDELDFEMLGDAAAELTNIFKETSCAVDEISSDLEDNGNDYSLENGATVEFMAELYSEKSDSVVEQESKLELKPLPDHLKYAYLEAGNQLPVIISKNLDPNQESKLLDLLRQHRRAIGWTLADIPGISPVICKHRIFLEADAKPIR